MTRRAGSGMVLILLVFGVLAVGAVMLGTVVGAGGDEGARAKTARVVRTVPCGSGSGDVVELSVHGAHRQARLDGCGHATGARMRVEVSTPASADLHVTMADDEDSAGRRTRLAAVLATLAALAGGTYVGLVRGLHRPT